MKIIQVHYSKKFNLGNYENHEIGVTVELDENDDPDGVLPELMAQVHDGHNQALAEQRASREEAERAERQKLFEERRKAAMAQMQANAHEEDDDEEF